MVQLSERHPRDHRVDRASQPVHRLMAPRVLLGSVLLAGVAAVIVARWWTATGYRPVSLGLPDPGALTAIGLPIAQFVHELSGVAVVGLLFLRCLGGRGHIGPGQGHLGNMASRWAWTWVGSTLVWILFTMSDLIGVPVSRLPAHLDLVFIVAGTNRVLGESATLWIALAVAMFGARMSQIWKAGGVLLVTTAALLPTALTGHASHHASPMVASMALGVHVIAAAVWVGGLLALIVHLRPFPAQLERMVPRFSVAALICVVAVGMSGVVESAVTLDGWAELWERNRGQLMIAKTIALVILVGAGYLHRRRTVGPACSGRLLPLLRLAAAELVLMAATLGIAVVLSTTG